MLERYKVYKVNMSYRNIARNAYPQIKNKDTKYIEIKPGLSVLIVMDGNRGPAITTFTQSILNIQSNVRGPYKIS
jgi:hypothetical protein